MAIYKTQLISPPDELKNSVECIRLFEYSGEIELSIKVSPVALPGLVFHSKEDRPAIQSLVYKNRTTTKFPFLFVYGPGTKPSVMNYYAGPWSTIQVIFKPHALRSLLGLDASTLTDNMLDWKEISGEDISQQLIRVSDQKERMGIISKALTPYAKQTQIADSLVEASLEYIHKNIRSVSKQKLIAHYHLSERQFEKRFKQTVGITPYAYIRVVRFNEALRLMKSQKFSRLIDIGRELNYYDQAHFIRDLKQFTGIAPKSLLEKVDYFHKLAGFSYT